MVSAWFAAVAMPCRAMLCARERQIKEDDNNNNNNIWEEADIESWHSSGKTMKILD